MQVSLIAVRPDTYGTAHLHVVLQLSDVFCQILAFEKGHDFGAALHAFTLPVALAADEPL